MLSLTISKTKKYDSIKHVNGRFVVLNEEINGWKIITRGANTYNLQNKNGTLAFPHENFASIEFSDGFYTAIKKNGNSIVLNRNATPIINMEFKNDDFLWCDGYCIVQMLNGMYNFLSNDGKILYDEDFVKVEDFINHFAIVQRKDGLFYILSDTGHFLSDEGFNFANFALHPNRHQASDVNIILGNTYIAHVIRKNNKHNFINERGEFLSSEDFLSARSFFGNFSAIELENGYWNFIDTNGKILYPNEYFAYVYNFNECNAKVKRIGEENEIYYLYSNGSLK